MHDYKTPVHVNFAGEGWRWKACKREKSPILDCTLSAAFCSSNTDPRQSAVINRHFRGISSFFRGGFKYVFLPTSSTFELDPKICRDPSRSKAPVPSSRPSSLPKSPSSSPFIRSRGSALRQELPGRPFRSVGVPFSLIPVIQSFRPPKLVQNFRGDHTRGGRPSAGGPGSSIIAPFFSRPAEVPPFESCRRVSQFRYLLNQSVACWTASREPCTLAGLLSLARTQKPCSQPS